MTPKEALEMLLRHSAILAHETWGEAANIMNEETEEAGRVLRAALGIEE